MSSATAHSEEALWDTDRVTKLEANLDDITGEHLACVMEVLMDHGALDVWAIPIIMKKGRPAHTLCCLCQDEEAAVNKLIEILFRHSTSLGIRIYPSIQRAKLERSILSVTTIHSPSPVRVKVSTFRRRSRSNDIVSAKPEFDDCKAILAETGVPVRLVAEDAIEAAKRQLQNG